jgi:hypothetical protein
MERRCRKLDAHAASAAVIIEIVHVRKFRVQLVPQEAREIPGGVSQKDITLAFAVYWCRAATATSA